MHIRRGVAGALRFGAKISLTLCLVLNAINESAAQQSKRDSSTQEHSGTVYQPRLSFDVASIRQSKRPKYSEGLRNPPHNSIFEATDLRVAEILGEAFGVNDLNQISGCPDWVKFDRYNVHAKAGSEADLLLSQMSEDQAKAEKRHMLQSLLVDRLNLKSHMEIKQEPVYFISLQRTPPKLEVAKNTQVATNPTKSLASSRAITGIEREAHDISISELATLLSYYLHMPVVDSTGLPGSFNFKLQYDGKTSLLQGEESNMWPTIEKAFADELGLNLRLGKGPVDILVIDDVTRPSDN